MNVPKQQSAVYRAQQQKIIYEFPPDMKKIIQKKRISILHPLPFGVKSSSVSRHVTLLKKNYPPSGFSWSRKRVHPRT